MVMNFRYTCIYIYILAMYNHIQYMSMKPNMIMMMMMTMMTMMTMMMMMCFYLSDYDEDC